MDLTQLLAGTILSAVVSFFIERLLRLLLARRWRYTATTGIFLLVFIVFALAVSAWARDQARWLFASPDDRQCFRSSIAMPKGATTMKDAVGYEISLNTSISWEPSNCVMVVQAYQDNSMVGDLKGQTSGKANIQKVGRVGVIEVKIFREGFETASSSVWVKATP